MIDLDISFLEIIDNWWLYLSSPLGSSFSALVDYYLLFYTKTIETWKFGDSSIL